MSSLDLLKQAVETYEKVPDIEIRAFLKNLIQKLAEEI